MDAKWKKPVKRVRLLKTLNPDALPIGSTGTILKGTMDEPGMLLIQWDHGATIPMYRNELEAIPCAEK